MRATARYDEQLGETRRGGRRRGEPEDARKTADKSEAKNAAPAFVEGHPAQRRLYATRVRRDGAQGSLSHERKPRIQGDDDCAPERCLRHRRVYEGCGGNEGEGSDRDGSGEGVSALLHDRERRVAE